MCKVEERIDKTISLRGVEKSFRATFIGGCDNPIISVTILPTRLGSYTAALCRERFSISVKDIDCLIEFLQCVKENVK